MKRYNEIIKSSLIDFEEIKFVLANNNIELVSSNEIRERYYLKGEVSLKNSNYKTIIDNSYILANIDERIYLINKTEEGYTKFISTLEIVNEDECINFLNHAGFHEAFNIEKNVYTYKDNDKYIEVTNLIGIGIYISVKGENAKEDELIEILNSFNIPYDDSEDTIVFEKLVLNKLRRYMK